MKIKEKKYEKIIGKMKSGQPVLANPDELTAKIMDSVENLPKQKTKYRFLQTAGILSGIASCLLICLFVKLALQQPDFYPENAAYRSAKSLKTAPKILPEKVVFDENFRILNASEKVEIIASIADKKRAENEKRRKIIENQRIINN